MKSDFYKVTDKNGMIYYKSELLENTEIVNHAFSTRIGGVSNSAYSSLNLGINSNDKKENVIQNFQIFADAVNISVEKMVLSNQVHDDKIRIVTKKDCGKGIVRNSDITNIDALITNQSNVALATFYADCTPLLILDPYKKVIASIHSGWRGTLLKIAQKTVLKMNSVFGSLPENLICVTGPSIKQCHFEVKRDVYNEFEKIFGESIAKNTICKNDKFYIDTDSLNVNSLISIGLKKENISVCHFCTFCNNDIFFSHRGDGGITGRMCAVIELK